MSSSWDGTLSPALMDSWRNGRGHPTISLLGLGSFPIPLLLTFSHQVGGYLSMEMVSLLKRTEVVDFGVKGSELGESSCFNDEDLADSATLVEQLVFKVHYFDFHIVYSGSYRVPVMYFRGYCTDGQHLALDEIEKDLTSSSSKVLTESKWTFITQTEHPYLNRPWFMLHPC